MSHRLQRPPLGCRLAFSARRGPVLFGGARRVHGPALDLRRATATSGGSRAHAIRHELIPPVEDAEAPIIRWYPWEPEESSRNDRWFRRIVFRNDEVTTP